MLQYNTRPVSIYNNSEVLKPISDKIRNIKHDLSASNMTDSDCSDSYISMCSFSDIKMVSSPLLSSTSPLQDCVMDENYSVDTIDCDSSIADDEKLQSQEITDLNYKEITKMLGEDTSIDDYISNLFKEEELNNSLSWYNHDKTISNPRKNAIDFLRNLSILFKLENMTLFKSIYYFDKLCSIKRMNPDHLYMVAAVCLFISAKFNELECNIPSLNKLSRECGNNYQMEIFPSSEIKILNALDFRLKIVLPFDFIKYYIYTIGVVFDDDVIHNCCSSKLHLKKKIKYDLEKFCIFFLNISAKSYSFWNYKPSILAFAVICASRRAMKIKPYFNNKLIKICRYEIKDIDKCFNKLWNKYHAKFPKNAEMFKAIQPKSLSDF